MIPWIHPRDLLYFLFPCSSISPLISPSLFEPSSQLTHQPLPDTPKHQTPPDTPFALSPIHSPLPLLFSLLLSILFLSPSQSHQSLDLPWIFLLHGLRNQISSSTHSSVVQGYIEFLGSSQGATVREGPQVLSSNSC